MLDHMEENAENETIREFVDQAREQVGDNVTELTMEKDGVDFSAEATVMFMLGAHWERHDIYTGADL